MTSTARSIESLTTARASPDRVLDELLFKGGSQDSDKSRPVDSTAAGLSGPPMLSRRSRPPRLCTRFHSRAIGGRTRGGIRLATLACRSDPLAAAAPARLEAVFLPRSGGGVHRQGRQRALRIR